MILHKIDPIYNLGNLGNYSICIPRVIKIDETIEEAEVEGLMRYLAGRVGSS
jgi:hypothetical protein